MVVTAAALQIPRLRPSIPDIATVVQNLTSGDLTSGGTSSINAAFTGSRAIRAPQADWSTQSS